MKMTRPFLRGRHLYNGQFEERSAKTVGRFFVNAVRAGRSHD